ncbi:MAG: sensor domain-containing diguanylate cyclase [Planctomycetota bacterium]|nr:sensor domain-containing diguanylate cyclase [Planctomycetota bacterium]
MQAPHIHPNEPQRLEALRALQLLDTDAEERFDRITRLARRLFDVPIALVSLVDADRQWFKSKQGLETSETPREVSFCGHAILGSEAMIVPDTARDPRFAANPLVTEDPRIAFYAGRPLSTPDGSPVGVLCLIDRTARDLDGEQLEVLDDLAVLVERELASAQSANLDALTRISNRRGFDLLAEKALAHCRRTASDATLLFIDMDGFKAINDEFGHEAGDAALMDMADLLLTTFRESDVVARIGGDEFCVLMIDSSRASTELAIRRLRVAAERHNRRRGRPYLLRFSIGVAPYRTRRHMSIADLLREADQRMYGDKLRQRNAP